MTLPATVDCGGGYTLWKSWGDESLVAFHDFRENVIKRAQDTSSLGMVGGIELSYFVFVTLGAVLGRDNRSDELSLMVEGISIAFISRMTFEATDICAEVLTGSPLLVEGMAFLLVAFCTGLCFR